MTVVLDQNHQMILSIHISMVSIALHSNKHSYSECCRTPTLQFKTDKLPLHIFVRLAKNKT